MEGVLRRQGRTTLFITHRLRLLAAMDRVLVLEKGRLVADGPLDDVLSRSAWLRAGFEAEALKHPDEETTR
jgi:ATP-binding cassette subfamily C protein LapB